MTIDEILDCNAEQLEAMTDAQLLEHFKDALDITRVDRQTPKSITKNAGTTRKSSITTKRLEVNEKLASIKGKLNVDLSFLND